MWSEWVLGNQTGSRAWFTNYSADSLIRVAPSYYRIILRKISTYQLLFIVLKLFELLEKWPIFYLITHSFFSHLPVAQRLEC